jgi:hypothetical protein
MILLVNTYDVIVETYNIISLIHIFDMMYYMPNDTFNVKGNIFLGQSISYHPA